MHRSSNFQFAQVPQISAPRSSFNRSFNHKTAFDAGYLIPIYFDEIVPGDTFNVRATMFGRLATPLHPVMDNMYLDAFYFFCPSRLLWDNFQKQMGEQDNPGDSTDFVTPVVTVPAGGFLANTLYDYAGVPVGVGGVGSVRPMTVSALYWRMYNKTWNQWFRDQNLQNSVYETRGNGPDNASNYVLLRRGKRHDYFTSALPWPQKGPAVQLPLGSTAPVSGIAVGGATAYNLYGTADGLSSGATMKQAVGNAYPGTQNWSPLIDSGSTTMRVRGDNTTKVPNIFADLSQATSATINQLRQAFAIQQLYERDARGGTRYTELIQSHFNVTSPDARLQRVEYLGGGSVRLNVNPIAQTSSTATEPTPQGNLAAMGTVGMNDVGFTKSFTEHGILMGLVMLRADLGYQQGLNRKFTRQTKFDYYWPSLAHIGEQAVYNYEIFADGTAADGDVWGYQERWADMRYFPSMVTGPMRSSYAQSLDTWHLVQDFAVRPGLGSAFIAEDPPIDRIIAVPSEPHLLLDVWTNIKAARPMPLYSVPGLTRM